MNAHPPRSLCLRRRSAEGGVAGPGRGRQTPEPGSFAAFGRRRSGSPCVRGLQTLTYGSVLGRKAAGSPCDWPETVGRGGRTAAHSSLWGDGRNPPESVCDRDRAARPPRPPYQETAAPILFEHRPGLLQTRTPCMTQRGTACQAGAPNARAASAVQALRLNDTHAFGLGFKN